MGGVGRELKAPSTSVEPAKLLPEATAPVAEDGASAFPRTGRSSRWPSSTAAFPHAFSRLIDWWLLAVAGVPETGAAGCVRALSASLTTPVKTDGDPC
jgi:hypothetical protein